MDYNTQMNQFLTGEVAMISHSSPIIPEMFNSESEILDVYLHSLHSHILKTNQNLKIHMLYILLDGCFPELCLMKKKKLL